MRLTTMIMPLVSLMLVACGAPGEEATIRAVSDDAVDAQEDEAKSTSIPDVDATRPDRGLERHRLEQPRERPTRRFERSARRNPRA